MKKFISLSLIAISVSLQAQEDLSKSIQAKWMMEKVVQDGNDVSGEHNPQSNRYIVFKKDGSFESGGEPYGRNTGKYFVDESKASLRLDSDAGEEDDSTWSIEIKENKMIWTGVGSEWAERFIIIYTKAEK